MTLSVLIRIVALSLAVTAAISCGEVTPAGPQSRLVGGACAADGDCAQRCLVDERHFPGGMCTVPCTQTADCPAGSICLAHEGGVCAVACRQNADCASFGRGFACDGDEQTAGGEGLVCRVP